MKIDLDNQTVFRDEDIRALVRKALVAVGYDRTVRYPLRVEFVHSRSPRTSGRAVVGTNRSAHGLWMKLRVPKPSAWRADTWREVVAVTIHECMHLVGTRHRDMTDAQMFCTLPLPAWAKDLQPLRVAEAKPVTPREERVAAARAGRLEHAQEMLKKAETRLKRATTIETKWRRRVAALTRAKGRSRTE
jgi:hypothetical protein